jgi:hypothetical protein
MVGFNENILKITNGLMTVCTKKKFKFLHGAELLYHIYLNLALKPQPGRILGSSK